MDSQRAEICCEIGCIKLKQQKYHEAIFWYEIASKMEYPVDNGDFSSVDCYGYIPYMQLCVCYDKLCKYKKACSYNYKAGEIKPNDRNFSRTKSIFINRKVFVIVKFSISAFLSWVTKCSLSLCGNGYFYADLQIYVKDNVNSD